MGFEYRKPPDGWKYPNGICATAYSVFLSLHSDARSLSNLRKISTKNYLVKIQTFEQKNPFCPATFFYM